MSLLQGFQPASQETQGYGSNKFWVAHRLRNFYGINTEVTWLFQMISCLVVFFLIWFRVAESGEQGSPEMEWTDLAFGDWLVSSADFWEDL